MVNVGCDGKLEANGNVFASPGPSTIQNRCSSCGLKWESVHDEGSCPLMELEMTFLSADWFMVLSEATS